MPMISHPLRFFSRRVEEDGLRETCPECNGSGKFGSGDCRHRDGIGEVPVKPSTKTDDDRNQ
jgi:DnaJ-class molecular chaperone